MLAFFKRKHTLPLVWNNAKDVLSEQIIFSLLLCPMFMVVTPFSLFHGVTNDFGVAALSCMFSACCSQRIVFVDTSSYRCIFISGVTISFVLSRYNPLQNSNSSVSINFDFRPLLCLTDDVFPCLQ